MSISVEKIMIIAKERIRYKLTVNNRIIQQIMKYNYLDTIIFSDRDLKEDLEEVRY